MTGRFLAAAGHGWSPALGRDCKAPCTLHPWTLYNCTLQFVPFCYFSEDMEEATQFWAPSLPPSLSLAANSGLPASIRKHAINIPLNAVTFLMPPSCMHAWINPGNISASQPRAELMVHATAAIDSSGQVLN